jgi:hypothetical protein
MSWLPTSVAKLLLGWRHPKVISKPILVDREGVAYTPSRRVVLKGKKP